MQLFVRNINSACYSFEVEFTDTVLDLKEKIFDKLGIYKEHQRLIFAGKELMNYRCLIDYSIMRESTLQLALRFPSG